MAWLQEACHWGVGFKMKEPCLFSIRCLDSHRQHKVQAPSFLLLPLHLPLAARLSDTMDSDSSELVSPNKLSSVRCFGHGDSSQQ